MGQVRVMKILVTKKAEKELNRLHDQLAKNIVKHILTLAQNPYPANSKKLQGVGNWRLRVGSFRVLYAIDKKNKEITFFRVADRKTVYR